MKGTTPVSFFADVDESIGDARRRLVALQGERPKPAFADSYQKILHQLALTSPSPVQVGKKVFQHCERYFAVGASLFRQFTCVEGCTACCVKFTLDFLPEEFERLSGDAQFGFAERSVTVNGIERVIYTSDQTDNTLCDFLTARRPEGGLGCALRMDGPLSCTSAPQLQFIPRAIEGSVHLEKRAFGRAWAMQPRPQCEFDTQRSYTQLPADIALLERFVLWADYFNIQTILPRVIDSLRMVLEVGVVRLKLVWYMEEMR